MPRKYIDLTLPYNNTISGFTWEHAKTLEKDGWNARSLHIYSHAGTHMDAPLHFGVSDRTIDNVPLSACNVRAWLVKLTDITPSALIEVRHLGEELIAKIAPGDGIVFHTAWSKKIGTSEYRDQLPRISESLALWLVSKKVSLIGVEPPSVADVNNLDEVTLIHQILLKGDIHIVEGLTNLESLPTSKIDFWAVPLKIEGGDGAPCRAFALIDDNL